MMNRGVLQSSPVQQIMAAGNPSWWNTNNLMRPPPMLPPHHHHHHHNHNHQPPPPSSSSTTNFMAPPNINNSSNNSDDDDNSNNLFHGHYNNNINIPTPSSSSWLDDHTNHQHFHESWSQLLMGGLCMGDHQDQDQDQDQDQVVVLHQQHTGAHVDVKKESSVESYSNSVNNVYSCNQEHEFHQQLAAANWSSSHPPQMNNIPASSPQSCVTTTTFSSGNCCNSMLDFSSKSSDHTLHARHPAPDRSSECNSIGNGGALKKPKVQSSSTQSTFKVRKEKLGDRITALHQLVSPFGKTDTASVLLEAIGYIRFLQSQIEALSLPYLSSGAGNKRQPHLVQGERNCIFPEDPGQLLNDNCLKRKGGPDQDSYEEPKKDLRSRGLCLVPVSCTLHVGSDNGADYWAPALGGGFR